MPLNRCAFDMLIMMQSSSIWFSRNVVASFRVAAVLFFLASTVVEGTTGEDGFWLHYLLQLLSFCTACCGHWRPALGLARAGDGFGDRPQEWITFFTNWTWVLFGIWTVLGAYIAFSHLRVPCATFQDPAAEPIG